MPNPKKNAGTKDKNPHGHSLSLEMGIICMFVQRTVVFYYCCSYVVQTQRRHANDDIYVMWSLVEEVSLIVLIDLRSINSRRDAH